MRWSLWWGCGYWLCWGGNRILACCKASLISYGEALNLILNSCGDKICWVVGDDDDGGDAIHVEFVEVFSSMSFLNLRE